MFRNVPVFYKGKQLFTQRQALFEKLFLEVE